MPPERLPTLGSIMGRRSRATSGVSIIDGSVRPRRRSLRLAVLPGTSTQCEHHQDHQCGDDQGTDTGNEGPDDAERGDHTDRDEERSHATRDARGRRKSEQFPAVHDAVPNRAATTSSAPAGARISSARPRPSTVMAKDKKAQHPCSATAKRVSSSRGASESRTSLMPVSPVDNASRPTTEPSRSRH